MSWGQALIEFRRTNKARSWSNFRAWHLKTDSKSAFATSLVGSRSPPLTTSFGISAFDMSRGTHPPTLPTSSRMHHFPNSRPPYHRMLTSISADAVMNLMAIKPRTSTGGEIQNASSSHERRLKRDRNQSFWKTVSRYADRDT